eukprot:gnl/Carplike_NY0171/8552_a11862_163.p1 GENE.gnl/Carplike_NY0171/8552_a11862_163~~gnl/Carplike_NY0171/8552_a11862_163.p1  ORF type:complete len:185 (+),score=66.30 gnl/Carplike_NY0171/8552_a11862_163:224-778(+)
MTRGYYRGSAICVLAFSTVDRASFEAVKKWMGRVEEECGPIPMILMQNKIDLLSDSSEVSLKDGDRLAEELDLPIVRTCVKDERGVRELFDTLVGTYFELKEEQEAAEMIHGKRVIGEEEKETSSEDLSQKSKKTKSADKSKSKPKEKSQEKKTKKKRKVRKDQSTFIDISKSSIPSKQDKCAL